MEDRPTSLAALWIFRLPESHVDTLPLFTSVVILNVSA